MSYFDHFADSNPTQLGVYVEKLKAIREFSYVEPHLTQQMSILEIGPGKGILAQCFIDHDFNNYSVSEPNKKMRQRLQKLSLTKIESYSIPKFNEEDSSYDLIIMSDVYEHLNGPLEANQFWKEVNRILKPKGYIYLLSPDYTLWKEDFFNCDYTHNNPTTLRRVLQQLHNHDLQSIKYTYFIGPWTGIWTIILRIAVRVFLFWNRGNNLNSKLYKIKLNFLGRYAVIGRKNS